ncbi:MAG: TrkH family potassium uptake protein, partial [Synergistaceae bacterium]|nr:TrkH family potassium uptake protein [Synergistaceae bacterium]
MKIKLVLRVLAYICLVTSAMMIFPLTLSAYDRSDDLLAFTLSITIGCAFSAMILYYTRQTSSATMGIREGAGITGFSWLMASFVGALPYRLSGYCTSYTDAFFETMSGFTTTGATILNDIEALPRGLLLWRSLTHWMGGMGSIVLGLAVLPFLGVSGMAMYKAEVPGIEAGKVTPRLHQTAVRLWGVYVLLTLSEAILLMFGGMTLFDAICHSFST